MNVYLFIYMISNKKLQTRDTFQYPNDLVHNNEKIIGREIPLLEASYLTRE